MTSLELISDMYISRIALVLIHDMYILEISFHDINNLIRDTTNCICDIWNWIRDIMKLVIKLNDVLVGPTYHKSLLHISRILDWIVKRDSIRPPLLLT